MASKKKPSKPAVPAPLLKLKFDKFPERQVAVYFEPQKRAFYANFGFQQYESLSVSGLESKIKAAIKAGATPDIAWVPVIIVAVENYQTKQQPHEVDVEGQLQVKRGYIGITKGGVSEVAWTVPEKDRLKKSTPCYDFDYRVREKMKVLPKLPAIAHDGLLNPIAVLAYDEPTWNKLRAIAGQFQAAIDSLAHATLEKAFDRVFIPKAAAAPKPAAPKKKQLTPAAKERIADKLESFANAGRNAQKAVDQVIEQARQKAAKKKKPSTGAKKTPIFAQGPQPPQIIAKLGYPPGTVVTVSGKQVDIKPPNHVAMLYSVDWLEKRLKLGGKAPLYSDKQPPLIPPPEDDAATEPEGELVEA